jgi:hypothetical protein
MSFNIHRARDMNDVYNKVEEWLQSDEVLPASVQYNDFKLMYRGMELNDSDSLEQAGIDSNVKLFVFLVFD